MMLFTGRLPPLWKVNELELAREIVVYGYSSDGASLTVHTLYVLAERL